jgi:hypothetical protein
MYGRNGLSARVFRNTFVASYCKVRASFSNEERWGQVWHESRQWNGLMMSRPGELCLPAEIRASVLADVAERLGLCYPGYYPGCQPLMFDAVFSDREDWFPIRAAIEHENDQRDFWSEVCKLLSVRCPLKVGITYAHTREKLGEIEQTIQDNSALILKVVGEHPKTEYLFLVGKTSDTEKKITWYSLDFRADDGPQGRTFQLVPDVGQHQKGVV